MIMKFFKIPIGILAGTFVFLQFFTTYITVNNVDLTSFEAFRQYSNLHWSFNYLIFAILIAVLGYLTAPHPGKSIKSVFLYYSGFAIWILGIIGLFVFISNNPLNTRLVFSFFDNFVLSFEILLLIILFHTTRGIGLSPLVKFDEKIKDLKTGKNVIYEGRIYFNPPKFGFLLLFRKTVPLILTEKEIIFGVDSSPIIIPFKSLEKIKLQHKFWFWYLGIVSSIAVITNDKETYSFSWARLISPWGDGRSANRLTKQLYRDINGIIKENKKIDLIKWTDFYEHYRKDVLRWDLKEFFFIRETD